MEDGQPILPEREDEILPELDEEPVQEQPILPEIEGVILPEDGADAVILPERGDEIAADLPVLSGPSARTVAGAPLNPDALKTEYKFTVSEIPAQCKGVGVMLGIDEAGRGAVLGPMVYGAAYWPVSQNEEIEKLGFDDSKALKEGERERLYEGILGESDRIGTVICELSAAMISAKMLQRTPVSLNAMSHDAAIAMVHKVIDAGVDVQQIFVDTVGNAEWYEERLTRIFGDRAKVVVRAKADSLFKVVSAASICAKVTRDRSILHWVHPERSKGLDFQKIEGSGYPGDERTRKWLCENADPVFGYPAAVRFSWSTVRGIMEPDAVTKNYGASSFGSKSKGSGSSSTSGQKSKTSTIVPAKRLYDVDWEDEESAERNCMEAFCSKKPRPAKRVANFLTKRGFSIVGTSDLISV